MVLPLTVKFDAPGEYAVRLLLDGHEVRKAPFTVRQQRGSPAPSPTSEPTGRDDRA